MNLSIFMLAYFCANWQGKDDKNENLFTKGFPTQLASLCLDQNSDRLAVGFRDRTFSIFDLRSRACLYQSAQAKRSPIALAFLPGDRLVIGYGNGDVKLLHLQGFKETLLLAGNDWAIRAIAHNPKKQEIIVSSDDCNITVFDTNEFKKQKIFSVKNLSSNTYINYICFNETFTLTALGAGDGHVHIANSETYQFINSFKNHTRQITFMCFKDKRLLLTASSDAAIKWSFRDFYGYSLSPPQ